MNKDVLIVEDCTVKEALKRLNDTQAKTLLVIDSNSVLLGTVSDGDIRRYILAGGIIDGSIKGIYNPNPFYITKGDYSSSKAREILLKHRLELLPILSNTKKVVSYVTWTQAFSEEEAALPIESSLELPVVIMAGGKGTRMAPFTNVLPKPLIPIGEKTILEVIIGEFVRYGINDFLLSLNFKGEMIEAYFNSIKKDYNLNFIWEKDFYGTAGSLKLLGEDIADTFIVSNCDVIVKAEYDEVYKFHRESGALLTILSSIQHHKIPYGVVNFKNGGEVTEIVEKPEYTFTINTGVYILEKECLDYIPENTFFHMTDLIKRLVEHKKKVCTYPLNEGDYIDIGQWKEYKKALNKLNILS